MRLIDRIIQCRTPFIVESTVTGKRTPLSGAMESATDLQLCPIRYVLDNALTGLCTDLAYSKGTAVLACVDLIRVPAEAIWVEWCDGPWREALNRNGIGFPTENPPVGHFGIFIRSSADGLRGAIRSYWSSGDTDADVHASAAQARFYLDAGEECPSIEPGTLRVHAPDMDLHAVLSRCFHFEFEESWAKYYQQARPNTSDQQAILYESIGCVAHAVPVLLAFLLLLSTRTGLPQQAAQMARLNRARARRSRPPLADHIEVSAPLLPEYHPAPIEASSDRRRAPRLHHVRGHLVRREDRLFWRVPHLRGKADAGVLKSRTVVWRFDSQSARRRERRCPGSTP